MRTLLLTVLLSTLGAFSWAASAQETLDFYKQELSSFPAKRNQQTRAYAQTLADGLETWVLQNEKQTSVQTALLLQARLLNQAQENGAAFVTLLQLRYLFPQTDMALLTPVLEETLSGLDKNSRDLASQLFTKGPSDKATNAEKKEAETLYAFSK